MFLRFMIVLLTQYFGFRVAKLFLYQKPIFINTSQSFLVNQ
jgi:hypothetical protein